MPNTFLGFPVSRAKFAEFAAGVSSLYDRGDPAGYDFTVGDFTANGVWHDLDLSGIVPEGAKWVLMWCHVYCVAEPNAAIKFRKNGNANAYNISRCNTAGAGEPMSHEVIVPLDTNRIIEYLAEPVDWDAITLVVKGWML